MDKETFRRHLHEATNDVFSETRKYVTDELPSGCLYLISHNLGFNPNVVDKQSFPEDAQYNDFYVGPLDATGVVDHLWRNGRVPQWINTAVHTTDASYTYFLLGCSGCFTALEDFDHAGRPVPFSLRIPLPPPGWRLKDERGMTDMRKSLETNGKYPMPKKKDVPRIGLTP